MMEITSLAPREIIVPERAALVRLGFRAKQGIPAQFRELYQSTREQVLEVAKPLALVTELPCRWDMKGEFLELTDRRIWGKLAGRQLKNCEKLSLLLVTLGETVDRKIEQAHQDGDDLRSFFLDAQASELVEFATRKIDAALREQNNQFKGSARISPGYGDLSLGHNLWVVEVLGGEKHGITSREDSCILLPRKTISAFIGWRKPDEPK